MRERERCCCGRCWQSAFFSLLPWRWTDDLLRYAWAPFFSFLALALILHFFPPKYAGIPSGHRVPLNRVAEPCTY